MRYLVLIILLFSYKLEGQYHFDFEIDSSGVEDCCSGGMWRQEPEQRWCCDAIDPIEGSFSLHHCFDNPQEGYDYLVLWCDPLNTAKPFSVSFRIRHGFDPSSQNNWQLAFGASMSDGAASDGAASDGTVADGTASGGTSSDGTASDGVTFQDDQELQILSGLILGVNYTGSDDLIKILHVDNHRIKTLLSTSLNYQEQVGTTQAPMFRVEGDGDGNLSLSWSPDPAAEVPVVLGTCQVGDISWGRQIILRYRYTSARDRALWLDQLVLEGNFQKDTIAPRVSDLELLDERTLKLTFSENVVLSEASTFILQSEESPGEVSPDSLWKIEQGAILSFPVEIPNRIPHQLQVEGVADLDGNLLKDTLVEVLRNEARWGDLVFNELMVDPDPAVRHPEEYIELFKRSQYPAKLDEWRLKVNERSHMLNTSNVESLNGGDFMLIRGTTLPNDGAVLSLYSKEGTLVHATSYNIPWDGAEWKKEGGWSLESPDPDQVCRISSAWIYSIDPGGGTPGRANSKRSILMDNEPPVLLYAGVSGAGALLLYYSEPLQFTGNIKAMIRLDPGAVVPDSLRLLDPLREIVQLYFPCDFQDWSKYQLRLSGMSDCAGNLSDDHLLRAGAVSQVSSGSLLINEIMYDPEEGKPAYVELFLPGNNIFDLRDLSIHLVEEGGSPDQPIVLSPHSRLVLPGQYLVLTDCVPHLEEAYGLEVSGQWVELSGLSGLNSSSGTIYLTDRAGQVVDQATYSDEMHMELLDDPGGISLERISVMRPGSETENWHSAASISGYATPGRENSQSALVSDTDLLLDVQPEVFSPDNDGYEDLLKIIITTSGNDWVIGLVITDLHGNRIRVLANNHLAGPTVSYTWDGEGENGAMQPMGFYVIHARGFRPLTGEQWIRRRAVGLVYR